MASTSITDDLISRETAILAYITAYRQSHEYSPSIREIGAEIGVESTSLTDYYLRRLEKRGYIKRDKKIARSIVLTKGNP